MVFKALRKTSRRLTKRKSKGAKEQSAEQYHPLKKTEPVIYTGPPTHSTSSSVVSKDVGPIPISPKKQSREIATQTSPVPSFDLDNKPLLQDDRDPSARGSPTRHENSEGAFSPTTEASNLTPGTIWAARNEDDDSDLDNISRAETGASSMYDTEYSQGDSRLGSQMDELLPVENRRRKQSLRTVSLSESSSVSLMDQVTDEEGEDTIGDTTSPDDGTFTLTEFDTMDSILDEPSTANKGKRDWDEYLCPTSDLKVCGMTL
mmetsp:Transcript_35756/g.53316  ORF Transcript_35756/g.53316 Transcript_35756/m.53316 type:complete len:261 (-) Transcript_35756:286-1068(-)|eukprot:CAMPEP_0194038028 /NCGR_PEP_ID=MMETSP0009_2-20130614/10297_1 /TAXON_ID=210454 /ORGANISM="Grammatophora oceanica, Strain CCMP 410" /LENGTH=260 /DNA_ID=CAMNT_0038680391 /DNA_START=119 /DNA_END=901 /DNA_ORIENTATION=+